MEGTVTGQVAIGDYIQQVGELHGNVVHYHVEAERLVAAPLPSPVMQRPRPFTGLLDRQEELAAAARALEADESVELWGEPGIGKSVLLRRIAYLPQAESFPDGVIYLPALGQPEADLRQDLFDAFHRRVSGLKPTDAQIQQALQEKRALVLLDDIGVSRQDVETLMSVAPLCTFVLGSEEQRLWGEGRDIALHGLPTEAALALLERELGRPLAPEELPEARAICEALRGHPLHVLQAAAAERERKRSLGALAQAVQTPVPTQSLVANITESLSEPQRRVLVALAALDGAPTTAEHIAAVSGNEQAAADLEALQRLRMVYQHDERYRLVELLTASLPKVRDMARWMIRAVEHFATWADQHRGSESEIMAEAEALLAMIGQGASLERWRDVLRLVKVVEAPLTLAGRWQAWDTANRWGLEAARALGDRAAEAWALHQGGARALCLGDDVQARELLGRALRLRKSIGDRAGASVTQRNLDIASGRALPPGAEPRPAAAVTSAPAAAAGGLWKVLLLIFLIVGGGALVVRLWPSPPKLVSIEMSPREVEGGVQASLTIMLDKPAPEGGLDVTLASSHDVVPVPGRVTVPAGKRSASVAIPTTPVEAAASVILMASRGEVSRAVELTVVPRPTGMQLANLRFAPQPVTGGSPVRGVFELDRPAPRDGTVEVRSSSAVAKARGVVGIPAGARQVTFGLDTSPVDEDTSVTVTVSYGGGTKSARLLIAAGPPRLVAITLDRPTMVGEETVEGQVSLSRKAPRGGVSVDLSPSSSAVTLPTQVTIRAKQASGKFSVAASAVERRETVRITASAPGSSPKTAMLVVEPQPPRALDAVMVNPAQVIGGRPARVVVRLTATAREAIAVDLSSDSPAVLAPETITIERGNREGEARLATESVTEVAQATITASYAGITRNAGVRLLPAQAELVDLTLAPASIGAGGSTTGTVTLAGDAPPGGAVVGLSANSRQVRLPRQVTVRAGERTGEFRAEAAPGIAGPLSVRIKATQGSVSKTASLAIGAAGPGLAAVFTSPSEVRGGSHVAVLVRLAGAVPNGAVVSLSSNRPQVTVPGRITIAPGSQEATIIAETRPVTAPVVVTVTASYRGEAKTAEVVVSAAPPPPAIALTDVVLKVERRPSGGRYVNGTVILSGRVPRDTVIALAAASSMPGGRPVAIRDCPRSVVIRAGESAAVFSFQAPAGEGSVTVTVTATYRGKTKSRAVDASNVG